MVPSTDGIYPFHCCLLRGRLFHFVLAGKRLTVSEISPVGIPGAGNGKVRFSLDSAVGGPAHYTVSAYNDKALLCSVSDSGGTKVAYVAIIDPFGTGDGHTFSGSTLVLKRLKLRGEKKNWAVWPFGAQCGPTKVLFAPRGSSSLILGEVNEGEGSITFSVLPYRIPGNIRHYTTLLPVPGWKVLAIGGSETHFNHLNQVIEIDPAAAGSNCTNLVSLPYGGRNGVGAIFLFNRFVFFFGGFNGSGADDASIIDLQTRRVCIVDHSSPWPAARYWVVMVLVGDAIHVIGGEPTKATTILKLTSIAEKIRDAQIKEAFSAAVASAVGSEPGAKAAPAAAPTTPAAPTAPRTSLSLAASVAAAISGSAAPPAPTVSTPAATSSAVPTAQKLSPGQDFGAYLASLIAGKGKGAPAASVAPAVPVALTAPVAPVAHVVPAAPAAPATSEPTFPASAAPLFRSPAARTCKPAGGAGGAGPAGQDALLAKKEEIAELKEQLRKLQDLSGVWTSPPTSARVARTEPAVAEGVPRDSLPSTPSPLFAIRRRPSPFGKSLPSPTLGPAFDRKSSSAVCDVMELHCRQLPTESVFYRTYLACYGGLLSQGLVVRVFSSDQAAISLETARNINSLAGERALFSPGVSQALQRMYRRSLLPYLKLTDDYTVRWWNQCGANTSAARSTAARFRIARGPTQAVSSLSGKWLAERMLPPIATPILARYNAFDPLMLEKAHHAEQLLVPDVKANGLLTRMSEISNAGGLGVREASMMLSRIEDLMYGSEEESSMLDEED